MREKHSGRALLLALGLAISSGLGCRPAVHAAAHTAAAVATTAAAVAIISAVAPPPPRVEVVVTRPGFVWVPGHWELRAGAWVWVRGYYVPARRGYVYRPGRWVRLPDGRYRWYPGRWVRVR